ncbi:MAG: hypothetical protein ACLTCB_00790 [Merdibacter sp.]
MADDVELRSVQSWNEDARSMPPVYVNLIHSLMMTTASKTDKAR